MFVGEFPGFDFLAFGVGADARGGGFERGAQIGGQRAPGGFAIGFGHFQFVRRAHATAIETVRVFDECVVAPRTDFRDDAGDRRGHLRIGFGRAVEQRGELCVEVRRARVETPDLQFRLRHARPPR